MKMAIAKKLPTHQQGTCPNDGKVEARLMRRQHRIGNLEVPNALAYVCPECDETLALPHVSGGRVTAARREQGPAAATWELRVPPEVEDLALAIHATLGTLGVGERYTLPLHLGLHLAGREPAPRPSWKVFDDCKATERARPRLSLGIHQRLEGLALEWGAPHVSDVARWLIVAAWESITAGLFSSAVAIPDGAGSSLYERESLEDFREHATAASQPTQVPEPELGPDNVIPFPRFAA